MVYNHAERQTGQEAIVKVGTEELRVTNVSWTKEVNEDEVQMNNSLWATNVTTGLRVSGSVEYDGTSEQFRSTVYYTEADSAVQNGIHQAGEPKRLTMTVKETQGEEGAPGLPKTHTFTNVKFVSENPDYPSDGIKSTGWDFTAEKLD